MFDALEFIIDVIHWAYWDRNDENRYRRLLKRLLFTLLSTGILVLLMIVLFNETLTL